MFRNLHIKFVLFFAFCLLLTLSAENKQVVTEMQIADNDTVFKYSYLYNNQAQPVVETKSKKNGSSWENVSQKEWFSQADLPSRQVERIWANNKWNDSYAIRYQKDDSKIIETHSTFTNNIETDIRMVESEYSSSSKVIVNEYNKLNGSWELKLKTHFFYAANKLTDSTIVSGFDNNLLQFSYKTTYEYNADASCKSIVLQAKNDFDLMYINVSKSVFYYKKGTNNISNLRNLIWNTKTSKWENETKLEYYYDEKGSVSEEISWEWKTMFWEQVLRYSYEYDADNQLFKKLVSLPIYRDWRNTSSVNYLREPNSSNITIESVYGFWGGKAGEKLNTHIAFPFNDETLIRKAQTVQLTYVPFFESSVDHTQQIKSPLKAYPNPSHGLFYISNFDIQNAHWSLTTLNGSVIKTSAVQSATSLVDITDLPNGVYVLKIQSDSFVQSQKIVKY